MNSTLKPFSWAFKSLQHKQQPEVCDTSCHLNIEIFAYHRKKLSHLRQTKPDGVFSCDIHLGSSKLSLLMTTCPDHLFRVCHVVQLCQTPVCYISEDRNPPGRSISAIRSLCMLWYTAEAPYRVGNRRPIGVPGRTPCVEQYTEASSIGAATVWLFPSPHGRDYEALLASRVQRTLSNCFEASHDSV